MTCRLDGISGHLLDSSNLFVALDTCGVPNEIPGEFLRWSMAESSISAIAPFTSAGEYRLCWCVGQLELTMVTAGNWTFTNSTVNGSNLLTNLSDVLMNTTTESPCRTAEDYRVDVGGLFLIGATPIYNGFTCISGLRCELDEVVTGDIHDQDSQDCSLYGS